MEKEFDSSDFEGASDYAYHLEQTTGISENESLILAAKQYNIKYTDLLDYVNSFN